MRLTRRIILSFIILTLSFWSTFASENAISREDAFIFFAVQHIQDVPESYQYIDLKYTDVLKDSKLEDALQILVYLDLIKNTEARIFPRKQVDVYTFEKLAEKIVKISVSQEQWDIDKKSLLITFDDLISIQELLTARKSSEKATISINSGLSTKTSLGKKWEIFFDVYKTLLNEHYDKDTLEKDTLIQSAISWLTKGTDDKYTTYFPPTESHEFFETLEGEYEGIGAYVDMPEPGKLIIVSPIVGSPSESAGVKWGDHVTHVDDKEITDKNSIKEVVSWIKWPAGSYVTLTILREWETKPLKIQVKREKIILKDIEYKKLDKDTFYIQVKNFWEKVDTEFWEALTALNEEKTVKKVIFDLRNNPGGYLGKVSNMLSYFVEKWSPTAIVNYGANEIEYKSLGIDLVDFSKYELIFLQNWGSASASEIMIGTVKDYFPEVTIIGEQSFGKWSVQSLKNYFDGSTLKYTAAKWFTW